MGHGESILFLQHGCLLI